MMLTSCHEVPSSWLAVDAVPVRQPCLLRSEIRSKRRAMTPLFCTLDSEGIADLIRKARTFVCFAGPGIQLAPAQAIVDAAKRLGPEMITVALDCEERTMRMGFGDIEAVKALMSAGVAIYNRPRLRTALVAVDNEGFLYTPTALYLEAEPTGQSAPNAMRLSKEQLREALARLSPAAKTIATAQAKTEEERQRIASLPLEIGGEQVSRSYLDATERRLKEAPPVQFDVARQVRVFSSYMQYVELKLTGAAIQRRRITIPSSIQRLGIGKDLEGRLRTTFDLLEKDDKLSSKELENELNSIRQSFTPSLGKTHGRVVLKSAKPQLEKRLSQFREKLENHQENVKQNLQTKLEASRKQIVDYYLPTVKATPPDALLGQLLNDESLEEKAQAWLDNELRKAFPTVESLIEKMELDVQYKDVTFETLNRDDFLDAVKKVFPLVDWDKAYKELLAAGQAEQQTAANSPPA